MSRLIFLLALMCPALCQAQNVTFSLTTKGSVLENVVEVARFHPEAGKIDTPQKSRSYEADKARKFTVDGPVAIRTTTFWQTFMTRYTVIRDGKEVYTTAASMGFVVVAGLEDNDEVIAEIVHASDPWNAISDKQKGHFYLVTQERRLLNDFKKSTEGTPMSTAAHIAKDGGPEAMVEEIVRQIKENDFKFDYVSVRVKDLRFTAGRTNYFREMPDDALAKLITRKIKVLMGRRAPAAFIPRAKYDAAQKVFAAMGIERPEIPRGDKRQIFFYLPPTLKEEVDAMSRVYAEDSPELAALQKIATTVEAANQ